MPDGSEFPTFFGLDFLRDLARPLFGKSTMSKCQNGFGSSDNRADDMSCIEHRLRKEVPYDF